MPIPPTFAWLVQQGLLHPLLYFFTFLPFYFYKVTVFSANIGYAYNKE